MERSIGDLKKKSNTEEQREQDHKYNFHQCGFTQKMLEQLLVKRHPKERTAELRG